MKKTFKKLMAALLAVALLCAMAVPAFAADEATTETGTVTVQNVVSGKTYKIYRILDIDTHDSTYNSVVYKVNNNWKDFIKDFIKSTGDTYFTRIDDTTGVVTVKKDLTSDSIAALAAAAKTWLGSHTIAADGEQTAGASDTLIQFTGKKLGYYLLSSSNWGTENADAIFSLSSSNPNVTVQEKNGKPTIDKKIIENNNPVDSNTAGIGDYVQFQITVNVIDGQPSNYVIHDKMSAGLTFVNTTEQPVKVLLNNTALNASQYDIVTDSTKAHTDCTFEIKIHDNVLSANDKITVTYYGQVNSSAVINGDTTNEASQTYGTDGNSTWEKTTTKVFGFKVFKHAGTDTEHLLPGAEFRLYKTVGGETHYAKFDANGLLTGWTTGATDTGVTMTSNSDSALVLNGLDAGTYYLEEIKAPDGYNKLTAPVTVTITEDGKVNGTADGTVYVSNNAGATLPSTGGMGTTLFYVIGGGLMVAAVVLLGTKKRMENK